MASLRALDGIWKIDAISCTTFQKAVGWALKPSMLLADPGFLKSSLQAQSFIILIGFRDRCNKAQPTAF